MLRCHRLYFGSYVVDTSNLVFWRLAARVASVVVTLLQLQTSQTQLPPKLQFSHFTLFVGGQWTVLFLSAPFCHSYAPLFHVEVFSEKRMSHLRIALLSFCTKMFKFCLVLHQCSVQLQWWWQPRGLKASQNQIVKVQTERERGKSEQKSFKWDKDSTKSGDQNIKLLSKDIHCHYLYIISRIWF